MMTQPLASFNLALFFAAFGSGLSLTLGLITLRDIRHSISVRLFILLLLTAIVHWLHPWLPTTLHGYSFIIQSAAPALFWMFCRVTFAESKPFHYVIWLGAFYSFLAPLTFLLINQPQSLSFTFKAIPQWLEYVLVLAGLWEVLANWNHDLIEDRRRLRAGIMLSTGLAVGWGIVSFNLQIGGIISRYLALNIAILILAWLLLKSRIEFWPTNQKKLQTLNHQHREPNALPSTHELSLKTQRPLTTNNDLILLQELMATGFYRKENLTLAQLAQALNLPEYRLRATINQLLSYNNFNEYINALRINEAAHRLTNETHTPITNIALDVGYRTMSSFNRAFRKAYDCTPSEFRASQKKQNTKPLNE